MKPSLHFFSTISSGDNKYLPLYDNFVYHLDKLGLKKNHHLLSFPEHSSGSYNDSAFNKIVYTKLKVSHDQLSKGNSVFVSDLDIVFLRNPWEYLTSLLEEYDIIFQPDASRFCTGFYLARPSAPSIDLFDCSEQIKLQGDQSDQGYINTKIRRHSKRYKNLKIKTLDKTLFPYGNYWYNHQPFPSKPYIVHYNWVAGVANKINKMKKYGHWEALDGL